MLGRFRATALSFREKICRTVASRARSDRGKALSGYRQRLSSKKHRQFRTAFLCVRSGRVHKKYFGQFGTTWSKCRHVDLRKVESAFALNQTTIAGRISLNLHSLQTRAIVPIFIGKESPDSTGRLTSC